MQTPPSRSDPARRDPAVFRIGVLKAAAWISLYAERIAHALCWPICVIFLIMIGAAFGLYEPVWTGALIVLAFATACVYALATLHLPRSTDVRARLREAGADEDGAIEVLSDRPAANVDTELGRALWLARRRRARVALFRTMMPLPSLGLGKGLGASVRVGGVGILALGAVMALPGITHTRLAAMLSPPNGPDGALIASVWVTPPAYTGQRTFSVRDGDDVLVIPEGSEIDAMVRGVYTAPVLSFGVGSGFELSRLEEQSFARRVDVEGGDFLQLRVAGRNVLSRAIKVLADRPPSAALALADDALRNDGVVRLRAMMADDYGIGSASITLSADHSAHTQEFPVAIPIEPVATLPVRLNVGPTPFAGVEITATLRIADMTGRTAISEPVLLTGPEREFGDLLAQRVAGVRRDFLHNRRDRESLAVELDLIRDLVVSEKRGLVPYFALTSAQSRITHGEVAQYDGSAAALLWRTAMFLDQPGDSDPRTRFDAALSALMSGLTEGMHAAQRAALTRALAQSLAARMRDVQSGGGSAPSGMNSLARHQRLAEALAQLSEALASGDAQTASELLERLEAVMDALDRMEDPGNRVLAQRAAQTLTELDDLAIAQEELLMQTHSGGDADQLARQQGRLAEQAQELARKMGESAGQGADLLSSGASQMGRAERSLQAGQGGSAIEAQQAALSDVGRARATAMQAFSQQMAEQGLPMFSPQMRGGLDRSAGTDPLGRPVPNGASDSTGDGTEMPGRPVARQVEEIRDRLRAKRAEPDLEPLMRLYLDQLLDAF